MTNSYLVIASAAGLELIVEETAHAERFLMRRCGGRRRGHESCYWAYLETKNAELIRWLVACGQRRPALWLLNQAALEAGPVALMPADQNDLASNFFAP